MSTNDLRKPSRRRFLLIGCGAIAAVCTRCQGNGGDDSSTETAAQSPAEEEGSVPAGATVAITIEETAAATPISTRDADSESEPVPTVPASATPVRVGDGVPEMTRCPRGLVNDPYPGKCRRYIDENGNGYCDLSEVSV